MMLIGADQLSHQLTGNPSPSLSPCLGPPSRLPPSSLLSPFPFPLFFFSPPSSSLDLVSPQFLFLMLNSLPP